MIYFNLAGDVVNMLHIELIDCGALVCPLLFILLQM